MKNPVPRRAQTGNSSEPRQRRDAPLHRDAPRHHRHHDVSAADGRRPRHAHVARQLSNALQAAAAPTVNVVSHYRYAGLAALSLPPLPIETEPPVSTGCGATLAVPAHAGHHGCIQSCFVVRTRAARNGRAHLSPRLAGCIPLAAVATIPGSPPLPLSLPPPSPSDSSPPPGLIRGVQRPPRTNMGTHLGIADPPAAAPCRRRRPCRPRFHPLAFYCRFQAGGSKSTQTEVRTLRTSPSCSRQAWLAAC